MSTHVCSWPVSSCKFYSFAFVVDNFDSLGGKWERDILYIEERSLSIEVDFMIFEFIHEVSVSTKIAGISHIWYIYDM